MDDGYSNQIQDTFLESSQEDIYMVQSWFKYKFPLSTDGQCVQASSTARARPSKPHVEPTQSALGLPSGRLSGIKPLPFCRLLA